MTTMLPPRHWRSNGAGDHEFNQVAARVQPRFVLVCDKRIPQRVIAVVEIAVALLPRSA